MSAIQTVCVYCGSSTGISPVYREAAIGLAEYLVDNDMHLVNGGGSVGLMGVMADHVLSSGGRCTGVIPLSLKEKEVAHRGMTELIVTPDMHSRKQVMVNLSDAFIAIPGGFGTLDELFETLTWSQLHLHNKPIGILNVNNYFTPLIDMLARMESEGFLKPDARSLLRIEESVEALFSSLNQSRQAKSVKWT